ENGEGEEFSVPGLSLVEERWHDGVCLLHRPSSGGAEGEIRRLVRCWGVEVLPGMTKSQLSSQLKAASREGLLPLNGCLSYTYELPTLAVEAAAQQQQQRR
ncbi:unnamed protein product, partial [Ectocarpus sp. 8 AP-2014]